MNSSHDSLLSDQPFLVAPKGLCSTLDYKYSGTRPHAANKITETSSTGTASDHVVNYDANGNNSGNTYMGSTRTMIWDEENRLKQVSDASTMRGNFLYAPAGERTQRQTAAGDAFYVNQFFVLQPSGILPTKHIFAGDTRIVSKTDPISQVPMVSYYHPDHLGSTSYTSASDQTLLQHERYFPFGERDIGDQEECDLGRPDNMRRSWIFNSKELDFDTGLYYFGARYYDPKTSVWQSPDPILASYMKGKPNGGVYHSKNLGLYAYAWNNPLILVDPNGREPVLSQAGTAAGVRTTLDTSPSKAGLMHGQDAAAKLLQFGQTEKLIYPKSGFFNLKADRYVYTEVGGWIDMSHFMFYAGRAYENKLKGSKTPVKDAISDGFWQEWSDTLFAKHSAYSYEDLPSDAAGAAFGATVFDPKSPKSFGEQVESFLVGLGATDPKNAPNFGSLPKDDAAVRKAGKPSVQNKTTTPMFQKRRE